MAHASGQAAVTIEPVDSAATRRRFIGLLHSLYADRPEWRAPIRLERSMHLSDKHNPAFEHLE